MATNDTLQAMEGAYAKYILPAELVEAIRVVKRSNQTRSSQEWPMDGTGGCDAADKKMRGQLAPNQLQLLQLLFHLLLFTRRRLLRHDDLLALLPRPPCGRRAAPRGVCSLRTPFFLANEQIFKDEHRERGFVARIGA